MLFELLFLAFLPASVIALLVAVVSLTHGRRRRGKRILLSLIVSWCGYLAIVAIVSAITPQHVIPLGQERCFDEMCFAVVESKTAAELGPAGRTVKAHGIFHVVTIRVSSHSRGRAQREGGLRAMLWADEKSYQVSPEGQSGWDAASGPTAPLDVRMEPGESVESVQVFDLPVESTDPGLVLSHGFTPGYFVIGESPIFRKPTLMRINP